jgi:hypothetical protein
LVAGSISTLAMLMQAHGRVFLQETGLSFLAIGPNGEAFQ